MKLPSHSIAGLWFAGASFIGGCGSRRFANPHTTFLVKRFERTEADRRLHFESAMTLSERQNGDEASTGES